MAYSCFRTLEKSDIEGTGRLLDEGWQFKKRLSSGISNQFIDDLYNRAKNAGAYGGKITGAGGGGFLLLLVDPDKKGNVRKELDHLVEQPIKVETYGSRIVYVGE
jgi:D-glycero-alpha-D-manno-heptose-7-phosphate kinase